MKCKDAVQSLGDCSLKCNYIFELPIASQSHVPQKYQPSNLLTVIVLHLHGAPFSRSSGLPMVVLPFRQKGSSAEFCS